MRLCSPRTRPRSPGRGRAIPADRYPLILARSLRELGRELGVQVTDEDAKRLGARCRTGPRSLTPRRAAALAERYQLIILSNVDRDSFAASNRRLGVTFTSILTAQDIGSYKPSPRNFEALLAETQPARHRSRAAAARGPEPVPRPRAGQELRACPRSGSTAGTTGPAGARPRSRRRWGHPRLGVPVHAGLRRRRRPARSQLTPARPPTPTRARAQPTASTMSSITRAASSRNPGSRPGRPARWPAVAT